MKVYILMKKILGLLIATTSLTACDDGDLVFENLNFDGKEIQKCNDNELYFKTNNTEMLLVDFTFGTDGSILNPQAPLNIPKNIYNRTKQRFITVPTTVTLLKTLFFLYWHLPILKLFLNIYLFPVEL